MVQNVGKSAGYDVNLKPGEICIRMKDNVALVHDSDWKAQLTEDWGGPDADDALWVLAFNDWDNSVKVLAWRSPNQQGEYALFTPADQETYAWVKELPTLDSRTLPIKVKRDYLNLIDHGSPVGKGMEYNPEIIEELAGRFEENTGVLGGYCNFLMCVTSMNMIPDVLPAALEDIIDSTVKTGDSLKMVNKWLQKQRERLIEGGFEFPIAVARRLSKDAPIPLTTDHWTDCLRQRIKESMQKFQMKVEALVADCKPPSAVVGLSLSAEKNGLIVKKAYSNVIAAAIKSKGAPEEEDFDLAHNETVRALTPMNRQERVEALSWVLTSAINSQGSDAAAWQRELTAPIVIEMLRDLGLICRIDENGQLYTSATQTIAEVVVPAKINGVWMQLIREEYPDFDGQMSDIEEEIRIAWKEFVSEYPWRGEEITVETLGERLVALNERGALLGYIAKNMNVQKGRYIVASASADDGNLSVYLKAA